MKLDPEVAQLFSGFPAPDPTAPRPTAVEARALHAQIGQAMASFALPIASVRDFLIPGPVCDVKARLYSPSKDRRLPLLIFLHGGGWVGGDLDTHDVLCRDLANGAGCAVVAVDYRLAPEHKFPAAVNDCVAAAIYVLDHAESLGADPDRIAIGGDSAGGNLAAVVVQQLKGRKGVRPMFQLLLYPATDFRRVTPAFTELADAPGLSAADVIWCTEQYLASHEEILDPLASPVLFPDLAGTPATMIITAELDPLRDDGEAYAARLIAAGTDVRARRYLGMPHSFLSLPPLISRRQSAMRDVYRALGHAFAGQSAEGAG